MLSKLGPDQIIEGFDECMVSTWGWAGKREATFREEESYAQSWTDAGFNRARIRA